MKSILENSILRNTLYLTARTRARCASSSSSSTPKSAGWIEEETILEVEDVVEVEEEVEVEVEVEEGRGGTAATNQNERLLAHNKRKHQALRLPR